MPSSESDSVYCDEFALTLAQLYDDGFPDIPHRHPENPMQKQEDFRDDSLRRFLDAAKEKYDKGQEEHGGFIVDRVDFKDLEEEIIDLWFYIQALRHKIVGPPTKPTKKKRRE